MFGRSIKKRAIKALQQGVKVVFSGEFFTHQAAEEYGLNEQASATLYTEALALQIFILTGAFNQSFTTKYDWATTQFAMKTINEAITDYEMQEGLSLGSVSSFIFRRGGEIDRLTPQERSNGEQFWQSAQIVAGFDSRADKDAIAQRLDSVIFEYYDNVAKKIFR